MDHEDLHQLVQQFQRSRSPGRLMSWPKMAISSEWKSLWTFELDIEMTLLAALVMTSKLNGQGRVCCSSHHLHGVWAYCGGHIIGHAARYSYNWYFCSRNKPRSHRNRRRTRGSLELSTQSYDTFWIASNSVEVFLVINIFHGRKFCCRLLGKLWKLLILCVVFLADNVQLSY